MFFSFCSSRKWNWKKRFDHISNWRIFPSLFLRTFNCFSAPKPPPHLTSHDECAIEENFDNPAYAGGKIRKLRTSRPTAIVFNSKLQIMKFHRRFHGPMRVYRWEGNCLLSMSYSMTDKLTRVFEKKMMCNKYLFHFALALTAKQLASETARQTVCAKAKWKRYTVNSGV